MEECQTKIDAVSGPVFHAAIIRLVQDDGNEPSLFLALQVHHVAIDLISWTIIVSDLEQCLQTGSLASGSSTSFQTWCMRLQDHAKRSWPPGKRLPYAVPRTNLAYWGMQGRGNVYGDVSHSRFALDKNVTSSIFKSCSQFHIELLDVLLAGLFLSFPRTFGDRDPPAVYNESHGREFFAPDIDISSTVGWFTTLFPISAPVTAGSSLLETARRISFTRKSLPHNGLAYFASQLLSKPHSASRTPSQTEDFEVVFNYMSSFQALEREGSALRLVTESLGVSGDVASLHMPRIALIEVSAIYSQDQIEFTFSYNRLMRHLDRIERRASQAYETLSSTDTLLDRTQMSNLPYPAPLLSMDYDTACFLSENILCALKLEAGQIEAIYPTSPIQNSMLVAQSSSSIKYYQATRVLAVCLTGHGTIDPQRLRHAWEKEVQRHPILRTVLCNALVR